MMTILTPDGSAVASNAPSLSNEKLVSMMRDMIAARRISEKMVALQRQGRVPVFSQIDGQEAAAIGAIAALDSEIDWILRAYREEVALRDFPLERMPPRNIGLATQIPHAVGVAWALKLRDDPGVVLCFFGDGSTSEGDFYEGGNHAGVLKVPLVMMCVNNGWAISTSRSIQTATPTIAQKADAFGFPGVQVDGNDVLAVFATVSEAVDRARAGQGPTLIEAVTYRLGGHTTADDPKRYVPPQELADWKERDPIRRFKAYLESLGLWDPAIEADALAIGEEAAARRAEMFARADAASPDSIFDHVYAEPTSRMVAQREQMRAIHGLPGGGS